jgi:polar amino acid transport system substrate-binding protein
VNIALREAMSGVEYPTFKASFEKWFGETPPEPKIGFPAEHR